MPFPNPVSDVLNIEFDQAVVASRQATVSSYDVRLYDGQGNMVRQSLTKGGSLQFNVSHLPDGIYYLHVYDGVSNTPDIQQIVVEH